MSAGVLAVVYWPSHSAVLIVHTATLSWSFLTPRGFTYSGLSAAQAFLECFQILPQNRLRNHAVSGLGTEMSARDLFSVLVTFLLL